MSRSLTTKNLLEKKDYKKVQLSRKEFIDTIGNAELRGCWLIYGIDKNGKTALALQLAKDLALFEKVSYISAEEGMDDSFTNAVKRSGITTADKILWDEYMPLEDIIAKFRKPKSPKIIFIDNLTIYPDEFRNIKFIDFIKKKLPDKLIICLAHEERKQPFPAVARMAKKMSKVIINVVGLRAFVTGRFSKGGEIDIIPELAEKYWGTKQT